MNRVLLFEENPINSKLIKRLLEQVGYSVECVDSTASVRSILDDKTLDNRYLAMFLDVKKLPKEDVDLIDVIVSLKDLGNIQLGSSNATPILIGLVSGVRDTDMNGYLELGMDGYLPTPISLSSLDNLMKQYEDEIQMHQERFKQFKAEKNNDTLAASGLFGEVLDIDISDKFAGSAQSNEAFKDMDNGGAVYDEVSTDHSGIGFGVDLSGRSDINEEDSRYNNIRDVDRVDINSLMVTDLDSAYTSDVGRYLSSKTNIVGSFDFVAIGRMDTAPLSEREEMQNIYSDLNKSFSVDYSETVDAGTSNDDLNLGKIMTPNENDALEQLYEETESGSETELDEESFAINSLAHEIEKLVSSGYKFESLKESPHDQRAQDDDVRGFSDLSADSINDINNQERVEDELCWKFLETTDSKSIVPSSEYIYSERSSFEELDNAIAMLIKEAKLIGSALQSVNIEGDVKIKDTDDNDLKSATTSDVDIRENDVQNEVNEESSPLGRTVDSSVTQQDFVASNLIKSNDIGQSSDLHFMPTDPDSYDPEPSTSPYHDAIDVEDNAIEIDDEEIGVKKRSKVDKSPPTILESEEVTAIKAIFEEEDEDSGSGIDRVSINAAGSKLGVSDMELMQKIFDKYFVDSAKVILKLLILNSDEDHEAIGKLAQSIKTTSSSLSMLNISRVAKEIELQARYFVNIDDLRESVSELKDIFDKSYQLYKSK